MPTDDAVQRSLVEQLLKDAAAHEAERYDEIGRGFDIIERTAPRGSAPELRTLHIALTFWDGWIHARNYGWQSGGNIGKAEWPRLARSVAADLAENREIADARVCACFDAAAHGSLTDRVRTLTTRLRTVL